MSLARSYDTLSELGADASSIVLIKPTGAITIETNGKLSFAVSAAEVLEVLAGEPLPGTIRIRHPAETDRAVERGCAAAAITLGRVYIAYVNPFRLERSARPVAGQYVTVGAAQGLFAHDGETRPDDEHPAFTSCFPLPTRLPKSISAAQARQC